jgi:hypothetical protein
MQDDNELGLNASRYLPIICYLYGDIIAVP